MYKCARAASALLIPMLVACTGDVSSPPVAAPQFAKPGSATDPTTSWLIPVDASLAFQSDGKYLSGGSSVYANAVCGVDSKIFATTAASNSGDAVMGTDNPTAANRKCADYPRKVSFRYPDAVTEVVTFFGNLHEIQNTTYSIPLGATVVRALNLSSSGSASRCGTLKFRTVDNAGTFLGADSVLVTRVDSKTWDVATQAAPNNKAYCLNNGQLYNMPVRFRIVSATALP